MPGTTKEYLAYCEKRAYALLAERGLTPLVPYPGGGKPWLCTHDVCGRETSPRVNNLMNRPNGSPCKHCATNAEVTEEEALKILADLDLEPLVPYPGSQLAWSCRCLRCGSEDCLPRLTQLKTGKQRGCFTCGRARGAQAKKDGVEPRMQAGMLAAGVEPIDPYPGILKPWRCRCMECGSIVTPLASNVVYHGQGACKHCAGKYVDPEEARQVMLAVNLDPIGEYPGSQEYWPSKCMVCSQVNHTVRYQSSRKGHGCRYCGQGWVTEEEALARLKALGTDVVLVTWGGKASAPAQWTCSRGHEWLTANATSVLSGSGCPTCHRDHEITYARGDDYYRARTNSDSQRIQWSTERVAEALEPRGITMISREGGSREPMTFECREGHQWTVKMGWSVLNGGHGRPTGCPDCAERGRRPSEPSNLYLLRHDERQVWKIGISVNVRRRLYTSLPGFVIEKSWPFLTSREAHLVEQAVKRGWRDAGHPTGLPAGIGGYTETVSMALVTLDEVLTDITDLIELLGGSAATEE